MTTQTILNKNGLIKQIDTNYDSLLNAFGCVDLRIRWAITRARLAGFDPADDFRGLYVSPEQVNQLLGYQFGQSLWERSAFAQEEVEDTAHNWEELIGIEEHNWWQRASSISDEQSQAVNLFTLSNQFRLSHDEWRILLISLAPEIDARYERFFSFLHDDVTRKRPSVNLILNLLATDTKQRLRLRQLFTPTATLVRDKLIEVYSDSEHAPLINQYVRPVPHLVESLLSKATIEQSLKSVCKFRRAGIQEPTIVNDELRTTLEQARKRLFSGKPVEKLPILAISGGYGTGRMTAVEYFSTASQAPVLTVFYSRLSDQFDDLSEAFIKIRRDGILCGAILHLTDLDDAINDDQRLSVQLQELVLSYPQQVIITATKHWQLFGPSATRRHVYRIELARPSFNIRKALWAAEIGQTQLEVQELAAHFRFTDGQIRDAVSTARNLALTDGSALSKSHLFEASRIHSNQRLGQLATKITPRYVWDDIVLPEDTLQALHEVANTMKFQGVVYENWGFGQKLAIGRGVKALFAGEPGTGKTMSADIVAHELGLDLYKIDLSTVVDKYIGETEKNIGRIFDEAETSNAILFFDEADSLFSKRSEVKDSHDRHANIQTGYLLQRMEEFDGIVILATNLQSNIDEAFTRRLHFVIEFPFPEVTDRERIWRVTFPHQTPLAADIDFNLLANRFRVAGGNIRNIVLAAAFLAAEADEPVTMPHIFHAARREYQKMGRLINEHHFVWPQP